MPIDFDLVDSLGKDSAPAPGGTEGPTAPDEFQHMVMPDTDVQASESRVTSVMDHLKYAVPGAILGAVDTFGQSLRLIGKESVPTWLEGTAAGNYYTHHRDALETVGALGAMALPGTIAKNAIQAGSFLHRAVTFGAGMFDEGATSEAAIAARSAIMKTGDLFSKDYLVQSIFTSGADTGEIIQGLQARANLEAATTGRFDWALDANSPEWRAVTSDLFRTKIADSFKEQVAWETGVLATMNKSDTLYPSDWRLVDYFAMGLPLPAAATTVEGLFIKRQLARVAETAGTFAAKMRLGETDPSLLISRVGSRDIPISLYSERIGAADKALQADPGNKELLAQMQTWKSALNGGLVDDIRGLGHDSVFPGVTTRSDLGEGEIETVKSFVQKDKFGILGMISLEPVPETGKAAAVIQRRVGSQIVDLEAQLDAQVKKAAAGAIDDGDVMNGIRDLENKIAELRGIAPVVVEPGGYTVSAAQRSPIAQDFLGKTDVRVRAGDVMTGESFSINSEGGSVIRLGRDTLKLSLPESADIVKAQAGDAYIGGFNIQKYVNEARKHVEEEHHSKLAEDLQDKAIEKGAEQLNEHIFASPEEINTQSLEDRGRTQILIERTVDQIESRARTGGLTSAIAIDPTQNHLQADMAQELYDRLGPAMFARFVRLPDGIRPEDLRLISLGHKFEDYKLWRDMRNGVSVGLIPEKYDMSPVDFAHYVNLPQAKPGEMHPIMQAFESLYLQNEPHLAASFKDMPTFKMFVQENMMAPEIAPFLNRDIPTNGGMFHYGAGDKKAVMGIYRDLPEGIERNNNGLLTMAQNERTLRINKLATAASRGAPIGQWVFKQINGSALGDGASDISTLANGSQRGFDAIFQRGMAGGESRAIQSLDQLVDVIDRQGRMIIKDIFDKSEFELHAAKLLTPGNEAYLDNVSQYIHLRRLGFDLLEDGVKETAAVGADGNKGERSVRFVLDQTSARNQQLWRLLYKTEMPQIKGSELYMPAPTWMSGSATGAYKPFELKGLAADFGDVLENLGAQLHPELSHIKDASGNGPLAYRQRWVPAVNLSDPYMTNIRDATSHENYVTVSGKTPQHLQQKVEQQVAAYEKIGLRVYPEDARSLETQLGARDEALTKLYDFSDPLAQGGAVTGKQVGFAAITDGRTALQEMKDSYEGAFTSLLRRNRTLYYEPYINTVKMLNDSLGRTVSKAGELTVPQRWLNIMFDNPTLNPTSKLGQVYAGTAGMMDQALQYMQKLRFPNVSKHLTVDPHAQLTFDKAKDLFGENYAFSDAFDRVSSVMNVQNPWTSKGTLNAMNRVATTLTLRLFEIGQPLLHMMSLASTMPAVSKALIKPSEIQASIEAGKDWEGRISTFARVINPGGDDAIFSPTRLLATAAHDYWNAKTVVDGKEISVFEHAMQLGMLDHQIGEYTKPLMDLNPSSSKQVLDKAVELLSKPTDWSYTASRGIAFMAGRRIAMDGYLMKDARDIYAFANKFASDTVGDYRGLNKPQIFQGTVGTPLGLFTTFAWNYMQRMFKYIENKDTGAIMTQLGTQAMMFGGQSLPGWSTYVNHFASNYDGTSNPVTGLRDRFGDNVADWLLYGTISNLPKMFGASDGISLYTRGEAGIRGVPTVFNPTDAPVVRGIQSLFEGVKNVVAGMRENGVQPLQIAQNLAQYSMNRPFKNFVDTLSGTSLDSKGRIVNDNVLDPMSLVARALSLKPMQEAKNMEAHQLLEASKAAREQKMTELEQTVRYNLRQGNYNKEGGSELLAGHLREAYTRGLDPGSFGEFLRNNYLTAVMDRNTLQMMEKFSSMAKTPSGMEDMKKLWWSSIQPNKGDYER